MANDNFNRPDGGLGANWTQPSSSATPPVISSNIVVAQTTGNHAQSYWSADSFSDNQYSQCSMSGNMSGLSFNGAIVRAGSGVDKFYMGFAFSGGLYIYSRDTGVYTQLTTVATQANNGDILKLEAIGSAHPVTVNLYRNGTLAATWTSTSSANAYTGGYPGICLFLNAADLGKGLDNWEGASLTLSAAQGSFALTGEPVNLSRTIAVDSGLFALSGQNVTLTVGALSISPLTGFFVFTGYSANFITPLTSGALYVYSTSTARIDVSQQISDRIDVIP